MFYMMKKWQLSFDRVRIKTFFFRRAVHFLSFFVRLHFENKNCTKLCGIKNRSLGL